ncbi:hypothetical protein AYI70_g11952 [Smittium culicis]|uniref:Uncharacterized protein n=1 Tax=Smittium culicis TaxID=133412 RepID=A0A1R1WZK4_9FUNG|nr:hypothetical protein AYI70_g11952 [Smittium culicis]
MLNCHSHVMLKTFGSVYRPKLVPAMNTNIIRSISSHMLGNTKSGVKVALLPQLAVHMRSTSQRFCHNSGAYSARSAAGIPTLTRRMAVSALPAAIPANNNLVLRSRAVQMGALKMAYTTTSLAEFKKSELEELDPSLNSSADARSVGKIKLLMNYLKFYKAGLKQVYSEHKRAKAIRTAFKSSKDIISRNDYIILTLPLIC